MQFSRHSDWRQSGTLKSLLASALVVLVVLLVLPGRGDTLAAEQGDPSAAYLQAYLAFQDAVRFEKKGDTAGARRKYEQSLALFDGVKRSFPSWNARMVDIRTGKVQEALSMLGRGGVVAASPTSAPASQLPGGPAFSPSAYPGSAYQQAPGYQPAVPSQPVQQAAVPQGAGFTRGYSLTDQIQHQIASYEEQIRQLQAANFQVSRELESQKQIVQDSIAKIAAAKNHESSALQRIAHLEQQLAAEKQSSSEALAMMEKEHALLKGQLEKASSKESTTREQVEQLEQELMAARQGNAEVLARMQEERVQLERQLEEASRGLQEANSETGMLFTLLEESKAVADRYRDQRDAVIKERDQMAILVKTSEEGSEAALQELVARNGALQESLKAALDEVEKFTGESAGKDEEITRLAAEMERLGKESAGKDEEIARLAAEMERLNKDNTGKDEEIAQLKSQVQEVRTELVIIREKAAGYVTTIADLESRLESTMAMLEEEQAVDDIPPELQEENELLRGLIVRQLRQQVRQQQTNQLVRRELERLEGSSRHLIDRVARLTEERPRLSDAERELLEKYDLAPADEGGIGVTMVARVDSPSEVSTEQARPVVPPALQEPAAQQVESSENLAARAEDAFFARNFERAETLYEQYMKTNPVADKHGIALANLGVVRMRLKKFDAAQQALTKARAIHPDNAFIHFMLGMSHFWQDENDEALLALESASQLDPENIKVHQYIGVAATRLGELKRAEEGFLDAIALDPRYAPAHFNLAVIYATGDGGRELYNRAEQHYHKALETGAERDPLIERLLNEAKAVAGDDWSGEASG